jgi:hypothetical protein
VLKRKVKEWCKLVVSTREWQENSPVRLKVKLIFLILVKQSLWLKHYWPTKTWVQEVNTLILEVALQSLTMEVRKSSQMCSEIPTIATHKLEKCNKWWKTNVLQMGRNIVAHLEAQKWAV